MYGKMGWRSDDGRRGTVDIPFVQRGVRALHLIATPFPAVWHTPLDNADALDRDTIRDLAAVFRGFVTTLS